MSTPSASRTAPPTKCNKCGLDIDWSEGSVLSGKYFYHNQCAMTPKQAYEVRKAHRLAERERLKGYREPDADQAELVEMLDRFVTAIERMADAFERSRS